VSTAVALGVLTGAGAAGAASAPAPTAASGTLAAVSGTSLEVQNPTSGQVTVNWTGSTNFSQTVTVPPSTLAVGDCVTASGTPSSKSKTKSKTASITATTISISQSNSSGACSGFGGTSLGGGAAFGSGGFRGTGGTAGSGTFRPPSGTFPKGAGSRAAALGGIAFGKVTSISGTVLVVVGTSPKFTAPPKTKTSTKGKTKTSTTTIKPKLVTTMSKVTFTTSTTFSESMPASASALVVGQCVTALGPAGDTGAITATTISVRPPPKTGCVSFTGVAGFAGSFGRGGAGGGTTSG